VTSVLITGAGGQLGQLLAAHYSKSNAFTVWAYDKAALDITDDTALSQFFNRRQPDIVINCAAYTAVDKAEQEHSKCFAVNTTAAARLAQLCQQYGSLLISFSTDYVFAGDSLRPYSESDLAEPLNQYGHTKWLSEAAIINAVEKYLIIRTSWLFSSCSTSFVSKMWRNAINGIETSVVNDQIGSPTPAHSLADAVFQLTMQYANSGHINYGLYHYAGFPCCSWYEFAVAIFAIAAPQNLKKLTPGQSPFVGAVAQRPAFSCLNSTLFQQTFSIAAPDWRLELEYCSDKFSAQT
jgi:dTDP-4-dehydrorhamnose reductase